MLHIESPHQGGIYTPLSQAMTDSDSEEQLFLRHQQPHHSKRIGNRNPPDSLPLNQHPQLIHFKRQQDSQRKLMQQQEEHLKQKQKYQLSAQTSLDSGTLQPSNYTTNMTNTFRSVMMSDGSGGEPGSNFSSFNSDYDDRNTADNIAILGSGAEEGKDANANQPMSPMRRCCFVASLILCFLAIFCFIWIVPCGEENLCPAPADRVKTHNWLSNYSKIELRGGIHVVNGLRSWEKNLIFLYRGDGFFPEFHSSNNERNGIICIIGNSGAVAWYDKMHDEPIAIDCTLLDADKNGQTDCLVMDEYGELGVINPLSGQWIWSYKERSAYKIDASDFPLILRDLDSDGVLDILVVTSADFGDRVKTLASRKLNGTPTKANLPVAPRNFLRILSGRTGRQIGELFEIHECDKLRKLQLDATTQMVTFNCVRNNTDVRLSKTMEELFLLITNKPFTDEKTKHHDQDKIDEIAQHHQYGQGKDSDAQRNIYSLSGRELVVENRGKCPDNCNVTFILSDGRNGKVKVLRNFTQAGMYGMTPVQWHFKNSKPEMSGFVMKFWAWDVIDERAENNSTPNSMTNSTKNNNSNSKNDDDDTKNSANQIVSDGTLSKKLEKSEKFEKSSIAGSASTNLKKGKSTNSFKELGNKTTNKNGLHHTHVYPNVNEFDKFDHLIRKRETYALNDEMVVEETTASLSNITPSPFKIGTSSTRSLSMDTYKLEMITETVILVIFIGADTRIENTSQNSIIQFCRNENNEVTCQPDLSNDSILIADLDQDGSQELVSYRSTFMQASDDPLDYKLVTYLRLLRLQSELPGFYSKEKNN